MRIFRLLALSLLVQAPAAPAQPSLPSPVVSAGGFTLSGALVQGGLVRGIAPAGTVRLLFDGVPVAVAPDGAFVLGFDRDQGASARLVAERSDGSSSEMPLGIARRAWSIETIDVARRPNGPTEEFLRRRAAELKRIEAARAVNGAVDGWRGSFILPARGRLTGRFGAQRVYRGEPAAYHSGLDIAAGAGADVVAPADGVVVLAGPPMFSLEGNLVIVDHGMGLNSAFLHLAATAVRVGDRVAQGQKIGTVGATGRATGPHLHWSVRWRSAKLDPERLVAAR